MSCNNCKNYRELKRPHEKIFGYCFEGRYNEKGIPVYVPGAECKHYELDKLMVDENNKNIDPFQCHLCKEKMKDKIISLIT